MTPEVTVVETSAGPARLHVAGPGDGPVLALGHGAGGGIEAGDLQAVSQAAVALGWRCVLVEQPWRVAGRKVAAPPARLDRAWVEALGALGTSPRVIGGRSAGARVACRTARELGVAGVLLLAFPLHPPGRPERSRAGELAGLQVPALAVQGTRDAFGTAEDLAAASAGLPLVTVCAVPEADHSLRIPARSASAGLAGAMPAVEAYLARCRRE